MRQVPLPELLTKRRKELDLTQQVIADRAGLSKMGISHLENGKAKPSEKIILAVADAYELDADVVALAAYGLHFEPEPATPPRQLARAVG